MKFRPAAFALLTTLAVALWAAPAGAVVTLDVSVGWGDSYRPGRWTPVYVTAASDRARAVTITVDAPHGSAFGTLTRQPVTLNPGPATFPIYVPLGHNPDEITVTLRDAGTDRRITSWPSRDPDADPKGPETPTGPTPQVVPDGFRFVGTSGRGPAMARLDNALGRVGPVVGHVPAGRLPGAAVGYEGLDLLVLNRPDVAALSAGQRGALSDWVRGGGSLLVWPGDDPLPPPGDPFADLLPATVGRVTTLDVPASARAAFGLPDRFASLPGREVAPRPGTKAVPLLGDGASAVVGRAGFGRVGLVPFDASAVPLDGADATARFWRPVLAALIDLPDESAENDRGSYTYLGRDSARRNAAQSAVADALGDVPGAGSFGFGYVAAVLVGLAVIVGPVDWFVLKLLGKQPWTWATTAGWVVLVTAGAVWAGSAVKSGDLHFRTLTVVDEIDGRQVAAVDVAGLYAPQTDDYALTVPPGSWWQPLATDRYSRPSGLRTDLAFDQDYRGSAPAPMRVSVWNLRFLRGERPADGPGVIDADLRLDGSEGDRRLVGTVTNRGDVALVGFAVYAAEGYVSNGRPIPPGGTAEVSASLSAWPSGGNTVEYPDSPTRRIGVQIGTDFALANTGRDLTTWAADIADGRGEAVDRMLLAGGTACVYAAYPTPAPEAVKLAAPALPGTVEKHWTIVRAVVPLASGEATNP